MYTHDPARKRLLPAVLFLLAPAIACSGSSDFTASHAPDASTDEDAADNTNIVANPNGDERESGTSSPGVDAMATGDDVADVSVEPFVCDGTKDPIDQPCVLDDAFGVFVAAPSGLDAGSDAGAVDVDSGDMDGSKARPYRAIGQALANLGSKARVYVCNGAYTEQVNITTPVRIYGGLSCSAGANGRVWSYVGGTAHVMSPSSAYALSIAGVSSGSVTIEDVSFTSPNATAAGTSSIAALVSSSSVNLLRVTLGAGNGANGQPGADGVAAPNYTGAAAPGAPQVWSGPGVTPKSGGAGGLNACLRHGSSAGGDGGLGCVVSASLGTAGTASPAAPVTTAGRDGLAAATFFPMDGGIVPANDPGADGLPGNGGLAAPAQSYGMLSSTGWVPTAGGDGVPGNPGQGGAGATDPLYSGGGCGTTEQDIGGGGGGAGGCGGAGGKGGGGGGASIALAAVGSTIDLKDCNLVAAAAGRGGPGGAGQDGQAGGAGGDDSSTGGAHAQGATGGNGAGGSGGAGGTGGISAGILYVRSTIMSDSATTDGITLGPPGAGGAAGVAGAHPTGGALTTGTDGNPGTLGGAGASIAFLQPT